jgi:hypothetical protein
MADEVLHRTHCRPPHDEGRAEGVTQDVHAGWYPTRTRRDMLAIRTTATLIVLILTSAPADHAQVPPPKVSVHIDPASPMESRVGQADPSVLKMFADAGMPAPTAHVLTDAERKSLAWAFTTLPPVHQRVLRDRLRRISFLDGMPNTALTSIVDPDAVTPAYDLTIRAGVLHESVSEFLTNKERTCFDFNGSPRTVVVEAGPLEAIVYVLLHEATHMVDGALGLTPVEGRNPAADAVLLTAGVWTDRLTVASAYANPLLDGLVYRRGGRPIPVSDAHKVYGALQRTPFASLYASSNWHDDVAELVAWYHLTSRMGQPYRIVVRERDQEVLVYEPMASPRVQRRLRLLAPMYDTPPV